MMRVAIIALVIALAALGLAGFATFAGLNDDEAAPVAESGWSEAECENANSGELFGPLFLACRDEHDCAPYNSMLQAINDNCP